MQIGAITAAVEAPPDGVATTTACIDMTFFNDTCILKADATPLLGRALERQESFELLSLLALLLFIFHSSGMCHQKLHKRLQSVEDNGKRIPLIGRKQGPAWSARHSFTKNCGSWLLVSFNDGLQELREPDASRADT